MNKSGDVAGIYTQACINLIRSISNDTDVRPADFGRLLEAFNVVLFNHDVIKADSRGLLKDNVTIERINFQHACQKTVVTKLPRDVCFAEYSIDFTSVCGKMEVESIRFNNCDAGNPSECFVIIVYGDIVTAMKDVLDILIV